MCKQKTYFTFHKLERNTLKGILGKLRRAGVDTMQRNGESAAEFKTRIDAEIERVAHDPKFTAH